MFSFTANGGEGRGGQSQRPVSKGLRVRHTWPAPPGGHWAPVTPCAAPASCGVGEGSLAVWRLWVLAPGWAQPGRLFLLPFPVYGQDQVLGYALPGALPWGHLQLRIGLQLACERLVISRVLLLRPSADGAVASVADRSMALLSATLGSLHLLARPHLPVELPRSSSGALPEGPPGLLVFLRQLEACLTPSVAGSGLAEPSRIGSWPLVSPGCLLWQCSSIFRPMGAPRIASGVALN